MNRKTCLNIQVSQDNAATYLRRGTDFIMPGCLSLSATAKELLKLVKVCRS